MGCSQEIPGRQHKMQSKAFFILVVESMPVKMSNSVLGQKLCFPNKSF